MAANNEQPTNLASARAAAPVSNPKSKKVHIAKSPVNMVLPSGVELVVGKPAELTEEEVAHCQKRLGKRWIVG